MARERNTEQMIKPVRLSQELAGDQAGYFVELADGGPWLKNDLTWTPAWNERGVWPELADAEAAIAKSLSGSKT